MPRAKRSPSDDSPAKSTAGAATPLVGSVPSPQPPPAPPSAPSAAIPVDALPSKAKAGSAPARLPLKGWALDLARRWNSAAYTVFILSGNVYDVFAVQDAAAASYVPLKRFLARRLFPDRAYFLSYDIADGLTFGSPDMKARFYEWLEVYDQVEGTAFHKEGPPREFTRLSPLLRRFFLRVPDEKGDRSGVTLIIDFPEKVVPAAEVGGASDAERIALVTLLKWASSPEVRGLDVGVILVTESAATLNADLLQSPHIAQVVVDLPDADDRLAFLQSGWAEATAGGKALPSWSDLTVDDLAAKTSGLSIVRVQNLLAEATKNGARLSPEQVASSKKRLIEEFCQGLVRFKAPRAGVTLDLVATHTAAKKRLRELAWLVQNGKRDVLERGVLLPGRVGVGKSFLVDCFASECGLPVMEMAEFRSKWVGDTERQQMRILMTIRSLGPVIVIVDEADAVFGSREADGDSGVSGRVFAAFAAHIGDSTLRGRELWVAMTSRPDLLSIDMKRQGRFGLCIPLFPAQGKDDVLQLFDTISNTKQIALGAEIRDFVGKNLGDRPLTGSDVESILIRAKERAVLEKRDADVRVDDLKEAVESFIDPLDPELLALQELAAVLACSDKRYLPERYASADRAELMRSFADLRLRAGRR